jgi:hypothetical protein
MYRYGRENLPGYTQPDDPKETESPDFEKMYGNVRDDIQNTKIKA